MAKIVKDNLTDGKKHCPICDNRKASTYGWYKAKNTVLFPDGLFHICKECVQGYIQDENTMIHILQMMDKPFLRRKYEEDTKKYLATISKPQYQQLGFRNSDFFPSEEEIAEGKEVGNEEEEEFSKEVLARWSGYNDDDELRFLERYYQELILEYPSKSPMERNIYMEMAYTQLMINRNRVTLKNSKINKELNDTLSRLMADAGVKPAQIGNDDEGSSNTFGKFIAEIEKNEPIPVATGRFLDVDQIEKYVKKWFVDHFSKVLGISKRDDS